MKFVLALKKLAYVSLLTFAATSLFVVTPRSATAADPNLFVRILNNFRLFKNQDTQSQHLRDYCRYMRCASSQASDFNNAPPLCDQVVKAFAARNGGNACPANRMFKVGNDEFWIPNDTPANQLVSSRWDNKKFQYDVDDKFVAAKERVLNISVNDVPPGAKCDFALSRDNNTVASKQGIACSSIPNIPVEISDRPYKLSVKVLSTGASPRELTQEVFARNFLVVAMGDSISSGEALPHRFFKNSGNAPDQWLERRCHRSFFNFTTMAMAIASEQAPTSSFTYFNFACSGASVSKRNGSESGGLVESYPGLTTSAETKDLIKNFPAALVDAYTAKSELPAQIEDAKRTLTVMGDDGRPRIESPDYVVVTIGGNDVLFGPLIFQSILRTDCKKSWLEWLLGLHRAQPEGCLFNMAEARIKTLETELEKFSKALSDLSPKRVLLVGYMNPTHDESDAACKDEAGLGRRLLGPSAIGRLGYVVDSQEAERAYSDIVTPLNQKLKSFAENSKRSAVWRYVEPNVIRKAGMRGWCAKPSWFVNYDDSKARQHDQSGTAHPNIYGQNWLNWLVRCNMASDGLLSKELVCRSSECNCQKPPSVEGLKG